jgi:hypothetical protein
MDDDVNPAARGSGVDRRELIKRAAIAGGVVAWTAPTIQVLGASTAWGGEEKPDKKGTGKPCTTKPSIVSYQWAGGSCTTFPGVGKSTCEPETGGDCGGGVVYITANDGTITAVQNGGTLDSPTTAHGPVGFTFDTTTNNNNDQEFVVRTVSHAGTICQTVTFHVSCSDPAIVPGVQIGGLILTSWNAS